MPIAEPVLSEKEVDWLGARPVVSDGEDTRLVIVTPDAASSSKLLAGAARDVQPRYGYPIKTVIVFDSTLSLEETRKCAAEWGVTRFAARIRERAARGRHSLLLRRLRVSAVPCEVVIDNVGRPVPRAIADVRALREP